MMSAVLEKVEQDALSLPRQERAFLAYRLLSSLDFIGSAPANLTDQLNTDSPRLIFDSDYMSGEILGDVEAAWVAEAEQRYREYKKGRRKSIPASQVFAEADRLLG
uniref:Addiction module component n=1 Tax=Candidatus Kentrum sp. FM TaxID=2126340 RepID=A0A450TPF8_9GAMM|nr:MAG: Putative addiction module component [Candidatus Kentron sp. FM]VFJ69877.1 MAG: Putative addiction module component [Candidatus Kentron sp. FM]VFK17791.1 MAG: Putative addiction module component [Candidatus Kentron sp. FM]